MLALAIVKDVIATTCSGCSSAKTDATRAAESQKRRGTSWTVEQSRRIASPSVGD